LEVLKEEITGTAKVCPKCGYVFRECEHKEGGYYNCPQDGAVRFKPVFIIPATDSMIAVFDFQQKQKIKNVALAA
jgi:hypothetical protein